MDPTDEAGSASEHRAPMFELNPADWTTADEIRRRSFGTADHGFDPQEVRDYLGKLADWFSDLNVQLSRLRKTQQAYMPPAGVPAPQVPDAVTISAQPEVGGLAARMADVLREAEEHASRVRADAELRAEQVLAQSREEAERIRDENGGVIQRARAEAEERFRRATEARDALLAEIRSLRERLGELTGRLENVPPTDQPGVPTDPASTRSRAVHPAGQAAVPGPVVLPDAVPEVPSPDPVVAVETPFGAQTSAPPPAPLGAPEVGGRTTSGFDLWADPADVPLTVRPEPEDPTTAAPPREPAPAASNVRQFPLPEARPDPHPHGDDRPPA